MSLRINSEAPNFIAETTQGTINFHEWIIPPSVSEEQAKQKYPAGWRTLKPYLRVVAQPK